jgi:hypothetical protein
MATIGVRSASSFDDDDGDVLSHASYFARAMTGHRFVLCSRLVLRLRVRHALICGV